MRDVHSQAVSVLQIKGRGPTHPEEQFWSRTAKLRNLNLLHGTQQLFGKTSEEKFKRS